MCQLNIYCIPKSVDKEKVLEYMRVKLGYAVAECIDDEAPVPSLKDGFSFYISGGMRCNCGSVLCSHQDDQNGLSYAELKEKLKSENLDKLLQIKELMEQADYPKKKKAFEKRLDTLWKRVDKSTKDIAEKERELADTVFARKDISDEEKQRIMHEEVYPKVQELMNQAEKRPEYVDAMDEYRKFCDENQVMWQSIIYTLKRDENVKEFDFNDLSTANPDEETFEFILPSNCIYDAIERAKTGEFKQSEKEFDEIKKFAQEFLKQADEFKILCYWQDGDEPSVTGEHTVTLDEFDIDCTVFLKYNCLLTIKR